MKYGAMMDRYKTDRLDPTAARELEATLREMIGRRDHELEGFASPEGQRDGSVVFRWGHDHDFGAFRLEGQMLDRHVKLMERFGELLDLEGLVKGARVLDVGPWTGGTSLILAAMDARAVLAVEEVRKYVSAIRVLAEAFDIRTLEVLRMSLFELLELRSSTETFDVIHCSGVLYHLTDPLLGLRILYHMSHPGATLLLETAVLPLHMGDAPIMAYQGPRRPGWNWWFPSRACVREMLEDVGFENVKEGTGTQNRQWFTATRGPAKTLTQSGLSRPTERGGSQ